MSRGQQPKSIYPDAITFTLQDASALSGLSTDTLRRRAKEGALRFVRVGCRTLVNGDSLRAMLRSPQLRIEQIAEASDEMLKRLQQRPDVYRLNFAPGPCVYFLCAGGRVEYVGQSRALFGRLNAHVGWTHIEHVLVLPTPIEQLDAVEAAFIRSMEPPLNGRTRDGRVATPLSPRTAPNDGAIVQKIIGRGKVGAAP